MTHGRINVLPYVRVEVIFNPTSGVFVLRLIPADPGVYWPNNLTSSEVRLDSSANPPSTPSMIHPRHLEISERWPG